MKKKLKYIFILILSIIIGIIGYSIYDYNKHKDDCCSCCPNAKEGEVCITACCVCE